VNARNGLILVAILLGLAVAAVASGPAVGANAKIVGVWNGSSSNSYEFTITVKEENGRLQGNFEVQGSDLPMDNLQFDGSKLSFDLDTQQGEYSLQGTVDGNSMSGTYKSDGDSGTWKATRGQATASN
jgi:hypothetical protein